MSLLAEVLGLKFVRVKLTAHLQFLSVILIVCPFAKLDLSVILIVCLFAKLDLCSVVLVVCLLAKLDLCSVELLVRLHRFEVH